MSELIVHISALVQPGVPGVGSSPGQSWFWSIPMMVWKLGVDGIEKPNTVSVRGIESESPPDAFTESVAWYVPGAWSEGTSTSTQPVTFVPAAAVVGNALRVWP